MLKEEIELISEHLADIERRENQVKFNIYMKKRAQKNLESIEHEKSEYYKTTVGPFLKRYRNKLTNVDPATIVMIRFLEDNYNMFLYFDQPKLTQIAAKIIQNSMSFNFSINRQSLNYAKIINTLTSNDNPEMRRLAWENLVTLGEHNKDLYFHLFHLRKEAINKMGYPDLYKWHLTRRQLLNTDIPIYILFKTARSKLEELLRNTFKIKMANLHPWDLQYYSLQNEANKIFKRRVKSKQFKSILTNAVQKAGYRLKELNINFYKADIPYDGLCIGTYGQKAELLFNPRESFESLTYFFHEFGHAFHTIRQKNDYYLLAASEPDFFYEGVAYCFERIAVNQEFIENELGLQKEDAMLHLKEFKLRQLFDILSILVRLEFERRIYKHNININEIDKMYADIYAEFMGIKHPINAYWASTVYFAREMFSVLNYLLAEMIVEQTMQAINQKSGCRNYLEIMPLVDKYYILPGNGINWNDKIKNLTGSLLSPKFLIRSLA